MIDGIGVGKRRLPIPLAMAGWLARLIDCVAPKNIVETWQFKYHYSLWLMRISNGGRVRIGEAENNMGSIVARLLFALLFMVGAVLLLLSIPLISIGDMVADITAAVAGFIGVAALVVSLCGSLTDYSMAMLSTRNPLVIDFAFLGIVVPIWLLYIFTIIF